MGEARPARGGRQARQAERQHRGGGIGRPFILRNIPTYDVLSEENLLRIEAAADRILAETGIDFRDDPPALDHWRRAGAQVDGIRVRFEPGLLRELLKTAPPVFMQHARNPEKSVQIGGKSVVFAPAYGSPFVMDLDRGRRFGTLEDFRNFIRLAQASPNFHHSGGTICEPTDIPVNKRHLDMVMAHLTLSDAQAMMEGTMSMLAAIHCGANFILHSAGFLDGLLSMSYEKFMLDADLCGALHSYLDGIRVEDDQLAVEAFAEVGPGNHFFGCSHTMAHYQTAFWDSALSDNEPFEKWEAAGREDAATRANRAWKRALAEYEPPPMDEGLREGLADFVERRKASMADMWY